MLGYRLTIGQLFNLTLQQIIDRDFSNRYLNLIAYSLFLYVFNRLFGDTYRYFTTRDIITQRSFKEGYLADGNKRRCLW